MHNLFNKYTYKWAHNNLQEDLYCLFILFNYRATGLAPTSSVQDHIRSVKTFGSEQHYEIITRPQSGIPTENILEMSLSDTLFFNGLKKPLLVAKEL